MSEHNTPFDESLISAYVDGELSEQEKLEVESAIRNSPSLQKLARDLSAVRSMLGATASKSDTLTRSLHSPEWSVPNSSRNVTTAEALSKTPSSQSGVESNRPRVSFGLLASLAAIVLIFITTKLLIDAQPDSGPQIVMDGNAPGSSAPATSHMQSARPNGIHDNIDEADSAVERSAASDNAKIALAPMTSAPLSTDPTAVEPSLDTEMSKSSTQKLSTEAKEFLTYLEQTLNSEPNTLETIRWRFTTDPEPNTNALAGSTKRARGNSEKESIKDVIVELGPSADEIILQLTEDEAKSIFKLANMEHRLTEEFAKQQELLAIATFLTGENLTREEKQTDGVEIANALANGASEPVREKTWSIDFSPQPTNTVAQTAGGDGGYGGHGNDALGAAGMESAGMSGAGMSGAGGGYGGNLNADSQGAPSVAPGAALFSPKARTMRSADRSETQPTSSAKGQQLGPEQTAQTLQSLESADLTAESAPSYGAPVEMLSKEKLKRIRIKIKKEPSSSGSNE